jgi:hypothetical protein
MEELTFIEIANTVNAILQKENLKPALEINISVKLTIKNHLDPTMNVEVIQQDKCKEGFYIRHYIVCGSLDVLKFKLKQSIIEKITVS